MENQENRNKIIEDFDDENEILDCPKCGREYDDADADFYICHHCGHNANTGKTDARKITINSDRFGIDPDANIGDWG